MSHSFLYPHGEGTKKEEKLDFSSFSAVGGDSWTRTNDPIDVNDVLYRLSHATTLVHRTHTSPVGHLEQFVLPTEPCHHVYVPSAYQSSWTFGTVRPHYVVCLQQKPQDIEVQFINIETKPQRQTQKPTIFLVFRQAGYRAR